MARRGAEPTEMVRIDKRNMFVGFYDDTLVPIGKIRVAFVKYDKNNTRTDYTVQYLDEDDALLLADCIWNGDIKRMALHYQKKEEKFKSLLPFIAMGGKKGGREDGSDLARKFDIFAGNPGSYLIQGEEGKGRQNEQGLFVPDYGGKPDQRVGVYVTDAELKKIASVLRSKINAKMAAEYVYRYADELKSKAAEERAEREKHRK